MSNLHSRLLDAAGRRRLLSALKNRLLAVCFGAGVDSTAMLIALRLAGMRPHIITFADVAAEKPETMVHLDRIAAILADWGWPPIILCRKVRLGSTKPNSARPGETLCATPTASPARIRRSG